MRTPEQILGPYFPTQIKPATGGDLTTIDGGAGHAQGDVVEIVGQVLDLQGEPVPAVRILIWQANCFGRYAHPNDHTDHDRRGAALVGHLLGDRVAHLVGAHVIAKRYLVTTDPAYRSQLSRRSVETLALQGDALADDDLAALGEDPDLAAILELRRADERAKDPEARVPGLDAWSEILESLAR